MKPVKPRVSLHFLLAAVLLAACMKLDGFLFVPTPVPADTDLMLAATAIPTNLVQELATQIVTADGVTVNAYLATHNPNDGTPTARQQTTILYCHGNTGNIDNYALRVQALWTQGYNVLIYDYRGFGKTPGTPGEAGVYADGRAVRNYLTSSDGLGLDANRIAFYGWSLGAAACTQLAVEFQPPALILESPFASVLELIDDSSALNLPRPWFADAQFDNRGKIPTFTGNLLVMHGAADNYLQPKYGEEVTAAAQGHAASTTFWLVPGASHGTVPCVDTTGDDEDHGGCPGGFSDAYFQHVNAILDAAIP